MAVATGSSSSSGGRDPRMIRRAAASGFAGSTLEYYDFTVYASAAAIVLPQVFFPSGNPTVALIASLATYAVGYVARPIGAFVLGHLGDRYGRKQILVYAMMLMGVSTFLVGVLPTYHQVGILAPILVVILRLAQGFAVSGELAGAGAMIVEHAPEGKRGFFASFGTMGTQIGGILGAAAFIPLDAALPTDQFLAWGWRVPFLLSALVVIAALIIRNQVEETPVFLDETKSGKPAEVPFITIFRRHPTTVLRAVLMGMANVLGTTAVVFGTAYATQKSYGIGLRPSTFLWVPVAANVVAATIIPLIGRFSDRIGRRPMMIFGPICGGLLAYPYLVAVEHKNVPLTFGLAILMFGVCYSFWNATFASYIQELFPTSARVTGFAVSMNIALLITSFLPTIFAMIAPPGTANVPLVIGGATLGLAVVASLSALLSPETAHRSLAD
ncbi:MFS transporter [Raineyella sp. LH-20]|uniref:MFS transporter n=1 Tax=Raineyella sp. LH-20 TaxID=3081204 RepID=UPI002952AAA6|nr:MFS transporter [Raineyella sp. LH-20]WOP19316.1 MFS transporter [Raineyella sp. LH-20]